MDVENLNQFNKRLFKKYLGIYIQQRRVQLKLSIEQLATATSLSDKKIKLLESGQGQVSQEIFDILCKFLQLDPIELINIGKITQIQHIMDMYKEIDEHYPR